MKIGMDIFHHYIIMERSPNHRTGGAGILHYDKVVVFLNYREAVDYIEEIPKFTTKNPPEHTRELLNRLGNPEKGRKIIHVAGTNGKGSTCSYLNAMLMEGGYRCGLFTSPHLVKINERYKINDRDVDDETFLRVFTETKCVIDAFTAEGNDHPSYFETLFLMGMVMFAEEDVDYIILETGLGGRLDATNVIRDPLACIITSIGLDHTEYLGNTIPEIAGEKAGIIKPGVMVVYDGHRPEASAVIAQRARECGSEAYELTNEMYQLVSNTREGIRFRFSYPGEDTEELSIPYIAPYQMMNAALAYFTMKKLEPVHGIDNKTLIRGIANSHWEGRMETVLPGVIIDGAHNEDGIERFVETAEYFARENRIHMLFSAVSDKDYPEMIRTICERVHPEAVVTTEVGGYRSVPAQELAGLFEQCGCPSVHAEPRADAAFTAACENRGDAMLFCVGSLYLMGEIKAVLENMK